MPLGLSGSSIVFTSTEESLCSSIGSFGDCNPMRNDSNSCFDDSSFCSTFNKELDLCDNYCAKGKAKVVWEDSEEDSVDRLPSDPFGMGIRSAFTSISGWIQNFEEGSGSDYGFFEVGEDQNNISDRELFSDLNWGWNGDVDLQQTLGDLKINGVSFPSDRFDVFGIDNARFLENNDVEYLTVSNVRNWFISNGAKGCEDCPKVNADVEGGSPHDAMLFVLGYLDVEDLLSVEKVCRTLCSAVRNDPLLWRTICVNYPLNLKITDDALVKLSDRAQGTLQCLSLVGCIKITNDGLKCVFESNPGLVKLIVPGCVRVTIEGILFNLRALKSVGRPGLKHLRIAGFSVTSEQLEELQYLLGTGRQLCQKPRKPRYYFGCCGEKAFETCDDDRAIDIEMCPRCQQLRLVYDCPAEGCLQKKQASQLCRACILCIARCFNCGRCIKDCDYEETFCLDLLCMDCWRQFLTYQEMRQEKGSAMCTIISQKTTFRFSLRG